MKQVYDNLYVGDINDADNSSKHRKQGIDYIINLSGSGPGYETIKKQNYFHIPIADDGSNSDFLIQTIIETVEKIHDQATEEDVSVLIHCAVGTSRSVAVSAALMSLRNGKRVRENVNRIKKVRSSANPQPDLLDQVSRITSEIYN